MGINTAMSMLVELLVMKNVAKIGVNILRYLLEKQKNLKFIGRFINLLVAFFVYWSNLSGLLVALL